MRDTLGSDWGRVDQKDAYPYLVKKTKKDFTEVMVIMKDSK